MRKCLTVLFLGSLLISSDTIASTEQFHEPTQTATTKTYQIIPMEQKIDIDQVYQHPVTLISTGKVSSIKEERHEVSSKVTTYTMAMALKTEISKTPHEFHVSELHPSHGGQTVSNIEKLEEAIRGTESHARILKLMQLGLADSLTYLCGHVSVRRGEDYPVDFVACSASTNVKGDLRIGLNGSIKLLKAKQGGILCSLDLWIDSSYENFGILKFLLDTLSKEFSQPLKVIYLHVSNLQDKEKNVSAYGFLEALSEAAKGYQKTSIFAYPDLFKNQNSSYYKILFLE